MGTREVLLQLPQTIWVLLGHVSARQGTRALVTLALVGWGPEAM